MDLDINFATTIGRNIEADDSGDADADKDVNVDADDVSANGNGTHTILVKSKTKTKERTAGDGENKREKGKQRESKERDRLSLDLKIEIAKYARKYTVKKAASLYEVPKSNVHKFVFLSTYYLVLSCNLCMPLSFLLSLRLLT